MKKLDDYQIFLYCTVVAVVFFTYQASFLCVSFLDEVIMIMVAVSLLFIPVLVRKFKLFDKWN